PGGAGGGSGGGSRPPCCPSPRAAAPGAALLAWERIAHLDLFNQDSARPYRLQLHCLPRSLRALGVQNAVLEGASKATHLQSVMEGLSLYASVHWPTRSNGGMTLYDWVAGCKRLGSLAIEYDMRTFAELMKSDDSNSNTNNNSCKSGQNQEEQQQGKRQREQQGRQRGEDVGDKEDDKEEAKQPSFPSMPPLLPPSPTSPPSPPAHTPLWRLRELPRLSALGVFFADSHQDQLAGVLDQRLVNDVAELSLLEELEIWNVYGSDWRWPLTDFSPLTRLKRLRSLKMEALPPYMAFRIRSIMQAGVPYCKLRLVADNEMHPLPPQLNLALGH
ncbi:hypothetical protein Agub_g14940, partial [Astrephomene gubernaculifera]